MASRNNFFLNIFLSYHCCLRVYRSCALVGAGQSKEWVILYPVEVPTFLSNTNGFATGLFYMLSKFDCSNVFYTQQKITHYTSIIVKYYPIGSQL